MPSIPRHNRIAPVSLIGLVLLGILGGASAGPASANSAPSVSI